MNVETSIVTKLMESISVQDFKFDQVGAKVIPKSNYVIQGDKYQADIIVAAYSSTEKPMAFVRVGADTLPANQVSGAQSIANVTNGVVKYEVPASALGDQKFAGVIQLRKPGSEELASYYFKSSYTVAKPTAIVAATKMNVFYIGVENPVEISVPGIPDTKVKPSITSGCTLAKGSKGGYVVKCTPGAKTATINVAADMGSGRAQSMGKGSEFRVKPVPDPVAQVGGVEGGPIQKSLLMAGGAIIPVMKNFDFDLNFVIRSFTFTVSVGGDLVEKSATGNILTAEMKRLIQASNKGQKVFIDDIKAVGPDGTTRKLAPVNLKLM